MADPMSDLPEWQAGRVANLLHALGPIPISNAERASLTWLAGSGAPEVNNIAALIWRARSHSSVLAARDHDRYVQGLRQQLEDTKGAVITRHREADLLRGQLFDLCEWAGIDPGEDPHGALLAHLRGREGSP